MPPAPKPLHRALLLLPPAPSPATYAALKTAYSPSLNTVLKELARSPQRARERAVLDIALPCPHLCGRLDEARGPLYATAQSLVAGLYKLIGIVAAKNAIDTEDAEGVDARVIPVAYPRDGKLSQTPEPQRPEQEVQGPAIDLHTLATSPRSWHTIYSVACEEGERLLQHFQSASPAVANVQKVRGGIVSVDSSLPAGTSPGSAQEPVRHLSVAVGGTFDHLHIGHKLLLTMFAFVLARPSGTAHQSSTLTIGITGDALLGNKKFSEYLESWDERQRATHDFLSSIVYFGSPEDKRIRIEKLKEPGQDGRAVHVTYPSGLTINYVEIQDPFGPTITDETISALAISLETRSGGKAVNDKRAEKGWRSLEVFEVDVLDASEEEGVDETFQSKLSSTEIRKSRSERAG
ncbi:pantetheine-phosphate adenylyltransferase family protein-like protein [Massarina eburnea CBS 473.64]|uniref:Pantetheine-phosphate adenylyltransferase family protein-like protein n=1 Tax=Massarina eburnea CBS 473.64 TaxID=1395130 RepID=A0A6A6SAF8_9PLEO|nr:pantetheine-phosphate adenylyltransferase family protein-like protein [Massarina eburnea CBS 473.64]